MSDRKVWQTCSCCSPGSGVQMVDEDDSCFPTSANSMRLLFTNDVYYDPYKPGAFKAVRVYE